MPRVGALLVVGIILWLGRQATTLAGKDGDGVRVDKDKRTVTIEAKIAPGSWPTSRARSIPSRSSPAGPTPRGKKLMKRS